MPVEDERLTTLLLSLFRGRTDVYAVQSHDGAWFPVHEPLTREVVEGHLELALTVGVYPVVDGRVALVCFDVDVLGDEAEASRRARELKRVLVVDQGIPESAISLEFSGRKGFHVWVFLAGWEPVEGVRAWGLQVAARAGLEGIEVFPKGVVRDDGLGNLIKLPLAWHRVAQRRSEFLDYSFKPVDATEHLGSRRPLSAQIIAERVRRALVQRPPSPSGPARPPRGTRSAELLPCALHIMEQGEPEGARNHALFALALAAKRAGWTPAQAEQACETAAARSSPPVPAREVRVTVASAYRIPGDGFDCTQPVLRPHCTRTCPRYEPRFGRTRD